MPTEIGVSSNVSGGKVRWCRDLENNLEVLLKKKKKLNISPYNPAFVLDSTYPKEMERVHTKPCT